MHYWDSDIVGGFFTAELDHLPKREMVSSDNPCAAATVACPIRKLQAEVAAQ